jgi:DNA-binding CsgD family transcriptional regulator
MVEPVERSLPCTAGIAVDAALTEPELAVLSLIGAGHSVPRIAQMLRASPGTVENHKRRVYRKLGVNTQCHAVSRAISLGLFEPLVGPDDWVRPAVEPGRPTLVVVHAGPGAGRDSVTRALVIGGLPFVVTRTREPAGAHWAGWHRGPLVAVLVDPLPADWLLPTRLRAPGVVVWSVPPGLAAVVDALDHRAQAQIWRAEVPGDLCAVLTLVARGYLVMSAAYLDDLADGRAHDILGSIALGHTIRQTARLLGIAVKTVENTQARLFRKLGARNRAETLTIAYRLGLVGRAGSGAPSGLRSGAPRR